MPFSADEMAVMACLNDDAIVLDLVWSGKLRHEPLSLKIWRHLASSSKVCLDIGAYTGLYSLGATTANSKLECYAFEAIPHIYGHLVSNAALNSARIRPFNIAITSENKKLEMHCKIGPALFSSGARIIEYSSTVEDSQIYDVAGWSLDQLVRSKMIPASVDLVKIDVEGHEVSVLQGGTALLCASRPVMLIEVLNRDQFYSILEHLPERYTTLFVNESRGSLDSDEDSFFVDRASMNILSIPSEQLEELSLTS